MTLSEATPYVTARFTYSNPRPFIGDTITFDGSSSVSSASISNYSWNFGDGNTTAGASYSSIKHQYATANNFTCSLTVSSSVGPDTFSQTIAVIAFHDPFARFTLSPNQVHPNQTVTFNATTSKTLEGSVASYSWNFGDANITSGYFPTITHRYVIVNNYNVTLTVTSLAGNDTFSQILNVLLPPSPYTPPHGVPVLPVVVQNPPFGWVSELAGQFWSGLLTALSPVAAVLAPIGENGNDPLWILGIVGVASIVVLYAISLSKKKKAVRYTRRF